MKLKKTIAADGFKYGFRYVSIMLNEHYRRNLSSNTVKSAYN